MPHDRPTRGTPSLFSWARQWPTPTSSDDKRAVSSGPRDRPNGPTLPEVVNQQWATPLASEGKGGVRPRQHGDKAGIDLNTQAVLYWPTPTAGDAESSGSRVGNPETMAHPGTSLTDITCRSGPQLLATCTHGGPCQPALNPRFVSWLQNCGPDFWDRVAAALEDPCFTPSETPSSPPAPKNSDT